MYSVLYAVMKASLESRGNIETMYKPWVREDFWEKLILRLGLKKEKTNTAEYYSAVKRNKPPLHVTTSVNLQCNMTSEEARPQKVRHLVIPFVRHSTEGKNYRERKGVSHRQVG